MFAYEGRPLCRFVVEARGSTVKWIWMGEVDQRLRGKKRREILMVELCRTEREIIKKEEGRRQMSGAHEQ